jgi:cell division protein FtsX
VSGFFFLERELLGAIRARSASMFACTLLALLLFLACFAALFLLPAASAVSPGTLGANELVAYVSPRLAPASINATFLQLQERPDVQSVRYSLPEQITSDQTGGHFTVMARTTAQIPGLVAALRGMDGIVSVESAASSGGIALSPNARIGLLCGLVICTLLALVFAREGFRALLYAFRHEIRLMRLSGVSERQIVAAVEVTGLLIGLLAGVLIAAVLALCGPAISGTGATPALDETRIVVVGLVSLLLGALMGGLLGLLGAATLSSNRFAPIS